MARPRLETATTHLPPHDLEAEQSVLGAMLVNPNAITAVAESLSADDFYRDTHRLIYRAVLTLFDRGEEVDVVTLSAQLEREGVLERAGGREFVHTLAEFVPAAANAAHYAGIVREQSVLRALIRVGNEIAELGYQHPGDTPRASRPLRTEGLRHPAAAARGRVPAHQGSPGAQLRAPPTACRRAAASAASPAASRASTGSPAASRRPTSSSSPRAPAWARRRWPSTSPSTWPCDGQAPVAIFSLEMSAQELGERMMCSSARVSSHKVRTGSLSGDDYAKLVQAAGELEKADIFIDDSAGLNMFELRAKARRLQAKHALSLVIVDYLQLMTGDSRAENRQQEVSNISRSMKQLARELDVPVIAVSQLNRSPEARADREPQLSDLRESGAIEQDADMVMFIYEDPSDPASKGVVKLKIAKHRNGPTGLVRLGLRARLHQVPHAQSGRGLRVRRGVDAPRRRRPCT